MMGIRGLTQYISWSADVYLKPFELMDTYLVIDGNSVASQLYINLILKGNTSIFGGDYDEYYFAVKQFFLSLAKCNVTPIVLLDGGSEKKKIRTVLERHRNRVLLLKNFYNGDLDIKLFPIFITRTFYDVVKDMNIKCLQCYYEADDEIATTAKALNCPVLSLDSDFFIFDVKYIPFDTLKKEPVRSTSYSFIKRSKFCLPCSIYQVNNFLMVNNIDKSLLPIFVTLLGNDYVNASIFHTLLNHMIIEKNMKSYNQRRIHGVINWLKKESFESAIKGILLHVKNQDGNKVLKAIYSTANHYRMGMVSSHVHALICRLLRNNPSDIHWLKIKEIILKCPQEIHQFLKNGDLSSCVMDLITLKMYITHVQVEDPLKEPACSQSLRLLGAISEILCQYGLIKLHSYKVYARNRYSYSSFIQNWHQDFMNLNFTKALELSNEGRLKMLFTILNLDDHDISVVQMFPESWTLFMATCLYWIKTSDGSLTFRQVAALILMVISNQIVQKKVGYYRTNAAFRNRYKNFLTASIQPNSVHKPVSDDLAAVIDNITMHECVLIQALLMPLRQLKSVEYLVSTVHNFSAFQCCLFYTLQINILLNYPAPHMKVADFYCGTLLFNLYDGMKNCGDFVQKILSVSPGLLKIYNYLCQELGRYSTLTESKADSLRKKRRRKRKKNGNKKSEMVACSNESDLPISSDEEFQDIENSYSLLHKLQALNIV